MIDLYTVHEEKVQKGFLSIHPSRWLASSKIGSTGIFDFLSPEKEVPRQPACMIGDQAIHYFSELRDLDLRGKLHHKHGHFFASSAVANRYVKHVPIALMHESALQDMLSIYHPDGRAEVHTPVGYVDFLRSETIVEIKGHAKWKHALGQVLAYSTYYPDHAKVVHLYSRGNKTPDFKEQLYVCKSFNVAIMHQKILLDENGQLSRFGEPTCVI